MGGRAPPGQNMRSPCARSHWPAAVPGSRVPRHSFYRPSRLERQHVCRCLPLPSSPTQEVIAAHSRSSVQQILSLPSATDNHLGDQAPFEPCAGGPQAQNWGVPCVLLYCSYWLLLLKIWSLRQSRRGSNTYSVSILPVVVYKFKKFVD